MKPIEGEAIPRETSSVKETIQAETDAVVRPLAPTQSEPEVETAAPSKAPAGTTEADEIQIIPLGITIKTRSLKSTRIRLRFLL